MVDEPLSVVSPNTTTHEYRKMPSVLSIEGRPGSVRISKTMPKLSYANGSLPNLPLIGSFKYGDDVDRSSPDLPSPAALLGNAETYMDYTPMEDPNLSLAFSDEQSDFLPAMQTPFQPTSSFENGTFDFNAFENASDLHHPSAADGKGIKRAASLSSIGLEPEAKCRRVVLQKAGLPMSKMLPNVCPKVLEEVLPEGEVNGEVGGKIEAKQILPDWTNEFDADFVAYFADFAEFK